MATKQKLVEVASATRNAVNEAHGGSDAAPTQAVVPAAPTKQGTTRMEFPKMEFPMMEHMDKAMKSTEEMVTFGQGNLEAVMKSSQIWATGMQDLSKQAAALAQAQFEDMVNTFKALSGIKSLKDAADLHTNLARNTFEKTVAEAGRLTDASFKLAEQATAPLLARVTLAADKFAKVG
jgi:phasin family protein